MSIETVSSTCWPMVLRLGPLARKMTDHEFYEFCGANDELRIERTSEGEVIVMPPTGGEGGRRSYRLAILFGPWVDANGTGIGFDSSTAFRLPNRAVRSPDFAWVNRSRWEALTREQREEFPPLCPDFVVELRSRTDRLIDLKAKMEEYLANGAQLGWLIDPLEKTVYIYKPSAEVMVLDDPKTISGDPVLPRFTLDLEGLWGKE